MERLVVIILDDDPTGTQTVRDLTVYLKWDVPMLIEAMQTEERAFFLQTNSRALSQDQTQALHRQIAKQVVQASQVAKRDFLLVSRSDSTLRGHFPLETDALQDGLMQMGVGTDTVALCPCFFEGKRTTVHGEHRAEIDGRMLPVGQTEYAKDQTFGYHSSNLIDWMVEKGGGSIARQDCALLDVDTIRSDRMRDFDWCRLPRYLAIDGERPGDMQTAAEGLFQAHALGKRLIIRCAASLVQALCAQRAEPMLQPQRYLDPAGHGGLVVVGSHVDRTNRQLQVLRALDVKWICFDVSRPPVLMIAEAADSIQAALAENRLTVIYTSREVVSQAEPQKALAKSVQISNALAKVIEKLSIRPRFLIAKGGITSYDVVTIGLHATRARVLGCAAVGVPVWQLAQGSRFPGLPYVIFPGNVGDDDALSQLTQALMAG